MSDKENPNKHPCIDNKCKGVAATDNAPFLLPRHKSLAFRSLVGGSSEALGNDLVVSKMPRSPEDGPEEEEGEDEKEEEINITYFSLIMMTLTVGHWRMIPLT